MAEIEITLPTVQYGNVKVRATPEELGLKDIADGYSLGIAAAVYLNVFSQGFQKGATLDVAAPQAASQEVTEEQARRYLDDGLDGVTEIPKSWDEPVEAKPKDWETAAPAVTDEW